MLRTLAFCLRDTARRDDLPARYGGEEFALVVQGDGSTAHDVAERVLRALHALRVPVGPAEDVAVTASMGVATLGAQAHDKEGLVAAADAALYAAKRTGKDRVMIAGAAARSEASVVPLR